MRASAPDETHRPQIATDAADPATAAPSFYGLGWDIGYSEHPFVQWGHSGAFSMGATTCVNILPAEQLGIVALSNASPVGAPEAVCRIFIDLVTRRKIERDWLTFFGDVFAAMNEPTYGRDADYNAPPLGASPPAALSAYVGAYQNDLHGPLSITQDASILRLSVGNKLYAMRHFSSDIFTFQPSGENAFGPSPLRFSVDATGKAQSVLIDCFNTAGQGSFARG